MILRMWQARATTELAGEYVRHATEKVFPSLHAIAGHRGAYLVQRAESEGVEFVVLTLWESMDAVRKFAGEDPERAVVEPEAQAVLTSYDDRVKHYEVLNSPESKP
jgi:heme-degrading monooxygenase HmoA